MKKLILIAWIIGLFAITPTIVLANQQNGHFMPPSHIFSTGPQYRYALGRHTYVDIFEPDSSQANVRRDAQSSFQPPSRGVFSATVPTNRTNPLIRLNQPISPWQRHSPHAIPHFDTTGRGVNVPNPTAATSGGIGGFLMPTSITD